MSNFGGNIGGKCYSHQGGVNSSFERHLFGAVDPKDSSNNHSILHEKPVHRLMEEMLSKGHTIEEIAQFTGYTRERVGVILRQPWAQQYIVKNIQRSVQDEIKEFLESEVMPSLKVLTDLRDNAEIPAAVRQSSAVALIDRLMGKPNQPITTQVAEPSKLTNDELSKRVSSILGSRVADTPGVGPTDEDSPLTGQVGGN